MKTATFTAFLAIFLTINCSAQSDDGWFTTKAAAGINIKSEDYNPFIRATFYYNLENHFSVGTQTGVVLADNTFIPIEASLRIRPLGKKNIMPAVFVNGGYNADVSGNKNGSATFSTALGIETGFLRRINYVLDVGTEWFDKDCLLRVSAGIFF
ncbi:MAG: hypothetical protein IKQ70_09625 [Bacteroidales bacterium]|nr:hypothetical protein [Bacteroidales bacterium]MBR6178125.1 hypothetical protein [Bacteroidales bacterium]